MLRYLAEVRSVGAGRLHAYAGAEASDEYMACAKRDDKVHGGMQMPLPKIID